MNDNQNNRFKYTYSAAEREELQKIREKYQAPDVETDKMEQLRRLDKSAAKGALAVSLVFGILGVLMLGCGMSLIMTDLSDYFGMSGNTAFIVGIAFGTVGGILAGIAYPVHNALLAYKRKKIAPQILRLTDELLK